jgi:hypothetical protein
VGYFFFWEGGTGGQEGGDGSSRTPSSHTYLFDGLSNLPPAFSEHENAHSSEAQAGFINIVSGNDREVQKKKKTYNRKDFNREQIEIDKCNGSLEGEPAIAGQTFSHERRSGGGEGFFSRDKAESDGA